MSTIIIHSKQPDIDYHADKDKYLARVARNDAENPDRAKVTLPPDFPKQVEGSIVWEGKDWTSEDQWVYKLSVTELKEIDNALNYFKSEPGSLSTHRHCSSICRLKETHGIYFSRYFSIAYVKLETREPSA